jgi:hypothetical protein
MQRLMPLVIEVANDTEHWHWGVQDPDCKKSVDEFLIQYSLKDWCHDLGNCYVTKLSK